MKIVLKALLACCILIALFIVVVLCYFVLIPAYYDALPAFNYERDAVVVVEATNATLAGFDQSKRTIYIKPEGDAYVVKYSIVVPEGFSALLYSKRDADINVYSVEEACTLPTSAFRDGKLIVHVYRTGECQPTVIVDMKAMAALRKAGTSIGIYVIQDAFAIKEVEHANTTYSSITITPLSLSYNPLMPAYMMPITIIVVAPVILLLVDLLKTMYGD